ncbi:MAG TPA: methylated-DNA--[protein]-cysteine S-methyltransferase [Erysipelothrix sp.]|nr:methylated-DNA--[protein]-cysteine S-methyltransferase [Erysipelothrix sp.]
MKYSTLTIDNYELLYAFYHNELAYFGLKEKGLEDIKKDFPHEVLEYEENLNHEFENEINEYFKGALTKFNTPLYISGTNFQRSVYKVLKDVPYGKTISYTELASELGDVKKVRAVANAVGRNRHLILMPCHRIIAKDGSLGGFSAGLDLKKVLLAIES